MKIDVLKMIEDLRVKTLSKFPGEDYITTLAIIQVGNNPASNLYVKSKKKEMERWRIKVKHYHFKNDISVVTLLETIDKLNNDIEVAGIIIQLPLPDHLKKYEELLINEIRPSKNVDGFEQKNNVTCRPLYTPCTPKGIVYILNQMRTIRGKTVCLIGRGKTVGKPLIDILSKEPCTLICCNSSTDEQVLKCMIRQSDIIITAVGKPGLFTGLDVKPDALVIDAGISYVDGKQTGDFDNSNVWSDKIDYTPHLGGVGKMTVCMLAINTIESANNFNRNE